MLEGLTPDLAPRLVLAVGGVGIALVVLVLVLIFLKRRNSPLFIKGGKSREPRLLVLDAAAVDPKRRLVLIRRDDVEHLIMIGGPTDIVIESGIVERSKPASATVLATEERPQARAAVDRPVEPRVAAPAPDRRAEPARPVPVAQADRSPVPAAPPRSPSVVASPARGVAPASAPSGKTAPAINRLVEEPRIDTDVREDKRVSSMGAMLYGDDRDPMTPGRSPAVSPTQEVRPETVVAAPTIAAREDRRVEPVASAASAAEAVLEAARSRVLDPRQVTPAARVTPDTDAIRRPQTSQPVTASAVQRPSSLGEPSVDVAANRDGEPSDFERFLEAELDASGVFSQPLPGARDESPVTNAVAADPALDPQRRSPPVTGATPDITSESEVARLLGEIAVNRKT